MFEKNNSAVYIREQNNFFSINPRIILPKKMLVKNKPRGFFVWSKFHFIIP